MTIADYRLNALVRAQLVRRGIEMAGLEHGVTNGVVYLKGTLRSYLDPRTDDPSRARQDEAMLATRIERSLKQLPGIRDVILHMDRLTKVGRRWKPK